MDEAFLTIPFRIGLWLAGAASFCVLIAGAQVPYRLHWKEDLATLSPFNRKIYWVYYGFTGLTIIGFGVFTFVFHAELLAGDPVALGVAFFLGLWWTARVLIDAFVFDHKDWPQGRTFFWGHCLLTASFVAMAAVYLGLVLWHWLT